MTALLLVLIFVAAAMVGRLLAYLLWGGPRL